MANGVVKCWGSNRCSQSGTPADPCGTGSGGGIFTTPQDVPALQGSVSEVAAGGAFTCVRVSAGGSVKCFGTLRPAFSTTPAPVLTGTTPQTIVAGTPPLYSKPNPAVGATNPLAVAGGNSGNPLTYQSLTPSICAVVASSGGVDVTGVAQGKCRFTINQAGNAYYDPATEVTVELRVGDKLPQSITLGPAPSSVPVNGAGSLQATASSGLPVTFNADTPGVCSVTGTSVIGLAVGQCTVSASQPGDDYYLAAQDLSQSFPVVANGGTFGLTVTRLGTGTGTVTSTPAGIDCGVTCGANFASGTQVALVAAPSAGSIFTGWGGACSGTAACNVTLDALKSVTAAFVPPGPPRLGNISTRADALTGEDSLIGGFVIGGGSNKQVAVVATGPSLAAFGITNPLADPALIVTRSSDGMPVGTSDNWQAGGGATQLQASGFAPPDPLEAGLLLDLPPGAYTATIFGSGGTGTGVAVIGVYEVDDPTIPLINISTRGRVGTGDDVMIGGFVVQGTGPQTVAIVGTGPSLTAYGVTAPLANPAIHLVRASDQAIIASNDDWQTDPQGSQQLLAAGFAPSDPLEAGLYVTLPPGAYTAILSGSGGATGVGVIGVYRVN
jgi:hypothetical protein